MGSFPYNLIMAKKLEEYEFKVYQTRVTTIKVTAESEADAQKEVEFQCDFLRKGPANPWSDQWTPLEVHSELVGSKNSDSIVNEAIDNLEYIASIDTNEEDAKWYKDLAGLLKRRHYKKAAEHIRHGDTYVREVIPESIWALLGAKGYLR